MFTLLKVVGERARSPTTFVMITNQKCQLYHCTLGLKDSGSLDIQLSGSGDVTLSGTARAIISISQTGSGDFDMRGLSLSGI